MLAYSPQDRDVQWQYVWLLKVLNNQERSALVEQDQRLFRFTAPLKSFAKQNPFPEFQPDQDRPRQVPTTRTEAR